MSYRLRESLYVAWCQDRAVFLDALSNRYFCLSQATNEALRTFWESRGGALDHDALAPLLAADILVVDPGDDRFDPPASPLAPASDLVDASSSQTRCGTADLLRAAVTQTRARRWIRRRAIVRIQARLRQQRAALPSIKTSQPGARLATIVTAFERTSLLYPPLDHCLPRSLAFCHLAIGAGVPALLVIGVRATPFAAHAWVQYEAELLNDRLERVRQFAPIMSL